MDLDGTDYKNLPNLRKKGNAFYFDHGCTPRRWEKLGSDEDRALRRYRILMERRGAKAASGPPTVDAMLRDHMAALPGTIAKESLRVYRSWQMHLSAVFGHEQPEDVKQSDILHYLDNCKRTSFRGEISLLASAYKRWMRAGRLNFNPCAGIYCNRTRSKRDRLLLPHELDALEAHAPSPQVAVAFALAYATGLRPVDLVKLRWEDFDDYNHVKTQKTGVRQKFVVTPELRVILERARKLQSKVASPLVLVSERGIPYSRSRLSYWFGKAREAAKIQDAQLRDIRAMAGTAIAADGGELMAQAFLGHTDVRTTKIYLRGRQVNLVTPAVRRRAGKSHLKIA